MCIIIYEIKKGQFDDFTSMYFIKLPKGLKIDDGTIFDPCESLKLIKCKSYIFSHFSDKTIERCDKKIQASYENPIFNFQPDPSRVSDETGFLNSDSKLDCEMQSFNASMLNTTTITDGRLSIDELILMNLMQISIEHILKESLICHQRKLPSQIKCSIHQLKKLQDCAA